MNIKKGIGSIRGIDVLSLLLGGVLYGFAMYATGLKPTPWVVSTMVGGLVVSLPMLVLYRSFKSR